MALVDLVQNVAEQLTPSERRLVQEIVAKPRDVALGTAADLARKTGVHEATASRLAKKLGFESYAGFRNSIRDEFIVRTDPAVRVRNTLQTTRGSDLLGNLLGQEIEGLTALSSYVSEDKLVAVASSLAARRKVFVFARGNAEALAVLMHRRLRRMAVDAALVVGDSRDMAEQVLTMNAEDALIAFAFRRQPTHYAPLLERARKVGAVSIVIAGAVGPSLAPRPDHLLSAPRAGGRDGFQTLTVPMAICNALILALARANEAQSLRHLEALGELIGDFETR